MSARARVRIGDRVTCRVPERPYSSSAYNWRSKHGARMFEPGMTGEVVALPPAVRALPCRSCGKKHTTFICAEFQWPDGTWDRTAIASCNAVRA